MCEGSRSRRTASCAWLAVLPVALVLGARGASAVPIDLDDFDGSEALVDFNAEPTGVFFGSFTAPGITVTPEAGKWAIFAGSGFVIGTTGAAFNAVNDVGNADVTFTFDDPVSRFGVVFGSASLSLSAVVSAFDGSGTLVESQSFPSLRATFAGFQFSSPVSRVLIDRTDDLPFFTFVDDIRYLKAESIPEPSLVPLLATGLLTLVGRKSRADDLSAPLPVGRDAPGPGRTLARSNRRNA